MLTDYRIDRGFPLHEIEKGESHVFEGVAARVGIYLYRNPDGSVRRELVDESTLTKSTPITSAPVTLHHPEGGRVDAHNSDKVRVGQVNGEGVEPNTGNLTVSIGVNDAAAERIRGGLRGLSPGYAVRLDSKSGIHPKFGAYDARQISRDYNHLAIVGGPNDPARGGSTTSLRVDAAVEITPTEATMIHLLSILALFPNRTDAVDTDDEAAVASAIKGSVEALLDVNKTQAGEIESLRADAESVKVDPAEIEKARLDWFAERTALVETAKRYNVDSVGELDNAAIRRAVVKAAMPSAREDGDDAYFAAAFDILTARESRSDSVGRGIPSEAEKREEETREDSKPAETDRPSGTVLDFYRTAHISAQ